MWWSEHIVYQALSNKFKAMGKPIDFSQQFTDDLKAKVKTLKEEASSIGTNLHKLAECYVTKQDFALPETEPLKTMFFKFKAYWDKSGFKAMDTEKTMYSTDLDVCGTCDMIVSRPSWKGKYGILDIKTSKDFYFDMPIQLHTYKKLCEDSTDYKIDYLAILNVPKEPAKDVSLMSYKITPKYLKAFNLNDYKLIFCHPNKSNKFGYANIIKKKDLKCQEQSGKSQKNMRKF